VLLDVNMPGMGGIEACREIRRSRMRRSSCFTVRNAERDKVLRWIPARTITCQTLWNRGAAARIRAASAALCARRCAAALLSKELTLDFERRQ